MAWILYFNRYMARGYRLDVAALLADASVAADANPESAR